MSRQKPKIPDPTSLEPLGDLFYAPDEWISAVMANLAKSSDQLFVVLTKRARRMADYFRRHEVPENVILGVSVEGYAQGFDRIPALLSIRGGGLRMVSFEPLIHPLRLKDLPRPGRFHASPLGWENWLPRELHWVIVDGETGPGARPMPVDAARTLRDECIELGIPFWFKSWGWHVPPGQDRHTLDGKAWHQVPWNKDDEGAEG